MLQYRIKRIVVIMITYMFLVVSSCPPAAARAAAAGVAILKSSKNLACFYLQISLVDCPSPALYYRKVCSRDQSMCAESQHIALSFRKSLTQISLSGTYVSRRGIHQDS